MGLLGFLVHVNVARPAALEPFEPRLHRAGLHVEDERRVLGEPQPLDVCQRNDRVRERPDVVGTEVELFQARKLTDRVRESIFNRRCELVAAEVESRQRREGADRVRESIFNRRCELVVTEVESRQRRHPTDRFRESSELVRG